MKTTKFKVIQRNDRISKSTSKAPICLRITKDRKTIYKTLFHIEKEFWDENKQTVKKSHVNSAELNTIISQQKAEIEKEILLLNISNNSIGITGIRNNLQKKNSLDFFKYSITYLESIEKNGKYSNYKKIKSIITKLQIYVNKDYLPINNITLDFIKQYENYLAVNLKNNRNTIKTNMKVISKLTGDIYKNYDLNETNNPFRKYTYKNEQTERAYLDENEIKRINELKLKLQSPLFETREIFQVECNSGLRISDILCLKWGNYTGNEFAIRMRKTDKTITIHLTDKLKQIVENRRITLEKNKIQIKPEMYLFNILRIDIENSTQKDTLNAINSATAIINKNLKKIAKLANINKNISTHVGRHSFATLLITKGADIYSVKELLGHSDIKMTQIYAKLIDTKKQKAIELLND